MCGPLHVIPLLGWFPPVIYTLVNLYLVNTWSLPFWSPTLLVPVTPPWSPLPVIHFPCETLPFWSNQFPLLLWFPNPVIHYHRDALIGQSYTLVMFHPCYVFAYPFGPLPLSSTTLIIPIWIFMGTIHIKKKTTHGYINIGVWKIYWTLCICSFSE